MQRVRALVQVLEKPVAKNDLLCSSPYVCAPGVAPSTSPWWICTLDSAVICCGHQSHGGWSCVHQSRGKLFSSPKGVTGCCALHWHCGGNHLPDLHHQPVVSSRFQAMWIKSVNQPDFGRLHNVWWQIFYWLEIFHWTAIKTCSHLDGKQIFKLKVAGGKSQEWTKLSLILSRLLRCRWTENVLGFCEDCP